MHSLKSDFHFLRCIYDIRLIVHQIIWWNLWKLLQLFGFYGNIQDRVLRTEFHFTQHKRAGLHIAPSFMALAVPWNHKGTLENPVAWLASQDEVLI